MGDLSSRWLRPRGLRFVAPVLLAALGGGVAVAADGSPGQGLSVTVPELPVVAHDDELWVGPYPSRLDVLYNDLGAIDRNGLSLVDAPGRSMLVSNLSGLGQLAVRDGYIRLDQKPRAAGTASFRYAVGSPNGRSQVPTATVHLFADVLVLADDRAKTNAGTAVALDVAANDRLVVAGAEKPCGPLLFAHDPPTAHPVPIVLPEPARTPFSCPAASTVTTKAGRWAVQTDGSVRFEPARGFRGTATAVYRQTSENPFDLDEAKLTVEVGRGGTAVLGEQHGPHGSGGAQGGPIPQTGAIVGGALVVGLVLVIVGWRLRRRGALVR